jgi:hypothetical protein
MYHVPGSKIKTVKISDNLDASYWSEKGTRIVFPIPQPSSSSVPSIQLTDPIDILTGGAALDAGKATSASSPVLSGLKPKTRN